MPLISPTDPMVLEDLLNTIALQVGAQTGDIKFTARATAPTGWLIANGALVNRTTYADLYAAIGTTYGAGDGSTTFGLPDLRDRVPVGAGSAYVLGATVGAATHTHPLSSAGAAAISLRGTGAFMRAATSGMTFTSTTQVTASTSFANVAQTEANAVPLVGATEPASSIQPSLALTPLIKS